jgi:hypothetical protein
MVSKKQSFVGIVVAIITVVGVGSYTVGDINFGTIIGHQGDNIINNFLQERGIDIDVETFRQQCEDGVYTNPEILSMCKLV